MKPDESLTAEGETPSDRYRSMRERIENPLVIPRAR